MSVAPGLIRTDAAESRRRKDALAAYHRTSVYLPAGRLVCQAGDQCRASALARSDCAFYEGQGSTVGPYYDLTDNGRPLRILIVPMEVGRNQVGFSVEERTADTLKAMKLRFGERNQHMKGVTLALRLALGQSLGDDAEGEWIVGADGHQFHVLQAYAMANFLLCSSVTTGTTESRATRVMRANCGRHLARTIEILEPNMVISQGASLAKPLTRLFTVDRTHNRNLAECHLGSVGFVWANLYHPARNWFSLTQPYLTEVVEPTITRARRIVLS